MPAQALTDLGTIQEIAKAIAALQLHEQWPFYALTLVLALIVAALGAWGGAYFKIRGENFARKADLDNVFRELERQTELTEGISARISSRHWIGQERNRSLRDKLEEYAIEVAALNDRLEQEKQANVFGPMQLPLFNEPMARADMLQAMFFPELAAVHAQLSSAISGYKAWYLGVRVARLGRYANGVPADFANIVPTPDELAPFNDHYAKIVTRTYEVLQACRRHMDELLHETIEHERREE